MRVGDARPGAEVEQRDAQAFVVAITGERDVAGAGAFDAQHAVRRLDGEGAVRSRQRHRDDTPGYGLPLRGIRTPAWARTVDKVGLGEARFVTRSIRARFVDIAPGRGFARCCAE